MKAPKEDQAMRIQPRRRLVQAQTQEALQQAGALAFRLKLLRKRRDMTLDQVSEITGLNKGYLSRLERGEKGPSVSTVIKLAHALDTQVSYLFGETIDEDTIHIRRGEPAPFIQPLSGGPSYSVLTPSTTTQAETFLLLPMLEFSEDGHSTHGGEELFYVLDGEVEIEFPDRRVILHRGDFMQFPGHLPHRVRRTGPHASVLIVVVGR